MMILSFKILISSKEKSSSVDFYKKHFDENMIESEVANISDGDIAFYDSENDRMLGIFEIKTFGDLYSTIKANRILNQCEKLINHGRRYIFVFGSVSDLELIDFFDDSGKFNKIFAEKIIKDFYNVATWDFFINMKFFENKIDMVTEIINLFNRLGMEISPEIGKFNPTYISKSEPVQIQILSVIPGIETVLARRLMDKFKTVIEIGLQSEESLRSVKGIGKIKSKNIIESLSGEIDETVS